MQNFHEYKLENLDELYKKISSYTPTFTIDDGADTTSSEVRQAIMDKISTTVLGQEIDLFAQCQCKSLKGQHNIGKFCNNCQTQCLEEDNHYFPTSWYSVSEDDDYRFVHPYIYIELQELFDIDFLKMISGKPYQHTIKSAIIDDVILQYQQDKLFKELNVVDNMPTNAQMKVIKSIESMKKPKWSISFFKRHMFEILTLIANNVEKYEEDLHRYIGVLRQYERDNVLYSTKLPLPPKRIFSLERSKSKKLQSSEMVRRLTRIIEIHLNSSKNTKEDELDYLNLEGANIWTVIGKGKNGIISSKQGIVRQGGNGQSPIYGFRGPTVLHLDYSPRGYKEIHMPYAQSVVMFRFHIMNILTRHYGYTLYNCKQKIDTAIRNFDQEVYDVMCSIVRTASGGKGVRVNNTRNPSQNGASSTGEYITMVKSDPDDISIALSGVSVEGKNGDIDGKTWVNNTTRRK